MVIIGLYFLREGWWMKAGDYRLVAGGWTPPQCRGDFCEDQNWESNDGTDWPTAEGELQAYR